MTPSSAQVDPSSEARRSSSQRALEDNKAANDPKPPCTERLVHAVKILEPWSDEIAVYRQLYGRLSIFLFLWLGSPDQLRKMLKFLYSDSCPTGMLKAQNRNVVIAAVGSSLAALIGITSMTFLENKPVHWLCPAAWSISVFSAFLSAGLACKHTRFINNVLLEDSNHTWAVKKWFSRNGEFEVAHPPLRIVLLLSGTEMFFNTAVIAYMIGYGIYLGSLWLQFAGSSPVASGVVFILYFLSGFVAFIFYMLVRFAPHAREREEWEDFRGKLVRKVRIVNCTKRLQADGIELCVNPEHTHPGSLRAVHSSRIGKNAQTWPRRSNENNQEVSP